MGGIPNCLFSKIGIPPSLLAVSLIQINVK